MSQIKRIVLVGHCGPDSFMLKSAVSRMAPDLAIDSADEQQSLEQLAKSDALLLVNRVLSYGFDTTDGVDLIRTLASKSDPPTSMLISNYEDAQQDALDAGAMPGFGKSQLGQPQTAKLIEDALG